MKQNQEQPNSQARSVSFRVNENEYPELKKIIKSKGLLEKQPVYYTYKVTITLIMLLVTLALLLIIKIWDLQLLMAVFLGFVSTQLAFLAHDAGHRQIARSPWKNDILGLVVCLLVGSSYNAWVDKHNQHHSHPNEPGLDPDVKIPFFP